jgi:hypothetical protein
MTFGDLDTLLGLTLTTLVHAGTTTASATSPSDVVTTSPNRSIRRSDIDTEVDTVIMEDDMVMGTSMDPVTPTSWVP